MLRSVSNSNLATPILKKIIPGGRKKNIGVVDMFRDEILLRKRVNLKRVTLSDGRTFYARNERVSERNLPANVTIKRVRAIGPRQLQKRKQGGSGLLSSVIELDS